MLRAGVWNRRYKQFYLCLKILNFACQFFCIFFELIYVKIVTYQLCYFCFYIFLASFMPLFVTIQ